MPQLVKSWFMLAMRGNRNTVSSGPPPGNNITTLAGVAIVTVAGVNIVAQ